MFKQLAIAAALVAASSPALAQQAPKFYAGADVGTITADDTDGHKNGFGAFAGYKFNEYFAVEAGYHRLSRSTLSNYDSGFGYTASGSANVNQADLSVIGTLPLGSGFSVYGRLGLNRLEAKGHVTVTGGGTTDTESISESDNKALYGAGLSYAFTPAISARVEVQKPVSDLTRYAAGVAFGF